MKTNAGTPSGWIGQTAGPVLGTKPAARTTNRTKNRTQTNERGAGDRPHHGAPQEAAARFESGVPENP